MNQMSFVPEDIYYRPTGRFSPIGPLWMLLFGVPTGLILAVPYAYLVLYNPFMYINFIATAIFGVILGMTITKGVRLGKIRSSPLALLLGAVVGLIALYAVWVVWLHAFLNRAGGINAWVYAPSEVWYLIQNIAQQGAWSMRGTTPTGGFLYAVWGCEALMIAGISTLAGIAATRHPFCEQCETWAGAIYSALPLGVPDDPETLRGQLESGNLDTLQKLAPATMQQRLQIDLLVCPACQTVGFCTIESVSTKVDKKGKQSESKKTI